MASLPNISGKTVTPSQSSLAYIYQGLRSDDWVNRSSPQSSPVTISKRSMTIKYSDRHALAPRNAPKRLTNLPLVTVSTVVMMSPLTLGSGLSCLCLSRPGIEVLPQDDQRAKPKFNPATGKLETKS